MPSEGRASHTVLQKIPPYFDTLLSYPAIFVIIQTL
ncbi:Uncharacterised protein [Neisseria lactamica]|uniref:Uncharacterized protein n=1 Tax=Neisseria lactamica TaxID=486 RepID=A0A378VIS7_NEILA|nr:hypothetical protein DR91_1746 [Neisseria lactamica ATCC 23970]SUA14698.1 Uncharacterised protein [Neisseria lactamica]SUA16669.1 Uncharacterised protein [Neisseria lactamica]VTQ47611.1 Uncharacterised protein [Neisseria lactamica]